MITVTLAFLLMICILFSLLLIKYVSQRSKLQQRRIFLENKVLSHISHTPKTTAILFEEMKGSLSFLELVDTLNSLSKRREKSIDVSYVRVSCGGISRVQSMYVRNI